MSNMNKLSGCLDEIYASFEQALVLERAIYSVLRNAAEIAKLRAVAEAADEACRSCHAEDGLTLPPARASMEKLERAIYDARKGGAM